jgi:uncharacterized membrane protein YfcA
VSTVAVLTLGALGGGFVTGLAGFDTGLTALGLWLHVVSPAVNLAILGLVLCVYATQGVLTRGVWGFALVCLPATLLGAFLGIRLYGRVNDRQFRAVVLWLLLASGVVLMVSNLR